MATDEAIAEAVGAGLAPPTLRFYRWEPPCLSLGYSQPISDVDMSRLAKFGWDIVRRPTGGRAILHTDEMTYSITAPQDEPRVSGGVLESYRRLSTGLLSGLRLLGIEADAGRKAPRNRQSGPVCFEVPSDYEIEFGGRKLLGSAQTRRHGAVLQHGSLPLDGDLSRIVLVLSFPDESSRAEAAAKLLKRAITASEAAGRRVSWDEAVGAMVRGFSLALNLELVPGALTPHEREAIPRLREKHLSDGWINHI